jgi:hypothetical protein
LRARSPPAGRKPIADELEREVGNVLRRALDLAGDNGSSRLVNGPAAQSLLAELEHGERRSPVSGATATIDYPESCSAT